MSDRRVRARTKADSTLWPACRSGCTECDERPFLGTLTQGWCSLIAPSCRHPPAESLQKNPRESRRPHAPQSARLHKVRKRALNSAAVIRSWVTVSTRCSTPVACRTTADPRKPSRSIPAVRQSMRSLLRRARIRQRRLAASSATSVGCRGRTLRTDSRDNAISERTSCSSKRRQGVTGSVRASLGTVDEKKSPQVRSEALGHSRIRLSLDVHSHSLRTLQTGAADWMAGLAADLVH